MAGGKKILYAISRYGKPRYMTNNGDGTYVIEGHSTFTRGGEELFDFEGGPCLFIGDHLSLYEIISGLVSLPTPKKDYAKVLVKVNACSTHQT
jgi:hypothetical protein